jgi:hypothetical protein
MKENHTYRILTAAEFDRAFETLKWIEKIPAIKFPPEWSVQIIPPFAGTLVRFRINGKVSVYLDGYGLLGAEFSPYWEVYPYEDDVIRLDMEDIDGLLIAIAKALESFKAEQE